MAHLTLTLVAFFLLVGVAGILLGVWTAHRKKIDRLSSFRPVQLVRKIPTLPPVDARPQKPGPKPPERQWPGVAEQYEIIIYRDPSWRVIEHRQQVEELSALNPTIRLLKAKGLSGKIFYRSREVASWRGHGVS